LTSRAWSAEFVIYRCTRTEEFVIVGAGGAFGETIAEEGATMMPFGGGEASSLMAMMGGGR